MSDTTIDAGTVPRPRAGVVMVPVGDEAVLLDERSGDLHALDPLATLMWQCFDGSSSLGEIVLDVAEVFAVEQGQALRDLLQLVADLGTRGLLEGTGVEVEHPDHADPAWGGLLRNPPDP